MVKKLRDFRLKTKEEIQKAIDVINKTKFKIADVNTKLYRRNPLGLLQLPHYNKLPQDDLVLVHLEQCRLPNDYTKE